MGTVSFKKEKERNEKLNNEYDLRISMVAAIEFLLAVFVDIFSVFGKLSILNIIVGALSFGVILYGLNGKWLDKITNKKMLRKIISLVSTYSVIVFTIEKTILLMVEDWFDKIIVMILLISFLFTIIWFVIYCIKSKEWKWNVD